MSVKEIIYNLLVRRKPVIKHHYESYVDLKKKQHNRKKLQTWLMLLGMNFSYYILMDKQLKRFDHTLSHSPYCKAAESTLNQKMPPEKLAEELCAFDVISFDIFDTLIFRPLLRPTDLFYIVGEKLGYLDFTSLRIEQERLCRKEMKKQNGTTEIDINDIYNRIEKYLGIPKEDGITAELETEFDLCYANPYMKIVWDILIKRGKKIIITSDMYLLRSQIEKLLEINGFSGYEKLFLSNELKKSKFDGTLFAEIKQLYSGNICHVGDNMDSDIKSAKKYGITPFHYLNVNHAGVLYRAENMSTIIGSAYCGIVNAGLHCGVSQYSMKYEFGYIYAGILVLGYCRYIHELALKRNADKILFLARDGDILKQVYDEMYPDEKTEYVYWSRFAAAKLGANYFKNDFIRRFFVHKSNEHITIEKAIRATGAEKLLDRITLPLSDELTDKNVEQLIDEVYANWDVITEAYLEENVAAEMYFHEILDGVNTALAVDVGWAGSGAVIMNKVVNSKYHIPCRIIAVVAGANGKSMAENCMSEGLLQGGDMYSYCFSQSVNHDLYEFHSPAQGHNIFFEMMLGSPTPQFKGFSLKDGKYHLEFTEKDSENDETILEIHRGIKAFVHDYTMHFEKYPYMLDISGYDAYAPFMLAAKNDNAYLKAALGECAFDAMVGGDNRRKIKQQI